MFDDQDLGFVANFLGIFIFVLVIAYHYVMADPKYEDRRPENPKARKKTLGIETRQIRGLWICQPAYRTSWMCYTWPGPLSAPSPALFPPTEQTLTVRGAVGVSKHEDGGRTGEEESGETKDEYEPVESTELLYGECGVKGSLVIVVMVVALLWRRRRRRLTVTRCLELRRSHGSERRNRRRGEERLES
uniref:Dolichyl-diphosphooligosaccharide--protein glycosyltransferase subunit 4A n=1 Tax=Cannabis sativa TaxID=3483 RepID=A0A803P1P1_CANSA